MRIPRLYATVFISWMVMTTAVHAEENDSKLTEEPAKVISTDPELTSAALAYFDTLCSPLHAIKMANYEYLRAATRSRRVKKIENKRQKLLKSISEVTGHIKEHGDFQGDDALQSELIRYLDLSYIVLKQDFDKILDMEDIAEQSYDQYEAHQLALDMAVVKLNDSHSILQNAEKEYAKKYQFELRNEEDEITQRINRSNKVIEYYNGIYRVFFKVNKQDYYARKAVADNDLAGLEQHATTLVSFAEEGLEQLKQQKLYEGDNILLATAVKIVEFYHHEGEFTYPANVEFHLITNNFQKAMKDFQSIKESKRTQKDVDNYNKQVNIYNKAVKRINTTNKISLKESRKLIATWNKTVMNFFKKHT